jgi:hypothetical protein
VAVWAVCDGRGAGGDSVGCRGINGCVREVVGAAEVVFSHEALVLEAEVDDEEPVVPGIVDGVVKLPETDGVWDGEVDVLVDHTPHPPVIDGRHLNPCR